MQKISSGVANCQVLFIVLNFFPHLGCQTLKNVQGDVLIQFS